MKRFYFGILLWLVMFPAFSQTITDGLMMAPKSLCTGFLYTNDQWKSYWEGTLLRENGNIGTVSTSSVTWMGTYGITEKLNAIAMTPYVWTHASQGVLSDMKGIQDLTLALKYRFYKKEMGTGTFRAFAVGSYAIPLTNYSPDFLPLSIGTGSKRLQGRLTLNYKLNKGWYINGTTAYTWRGNVTLDRASYYTDGQLTMSNEVWMPNVMEFSFMTGYHKDALNVFLSYNQQNTLGGGDIRRQDMPFVSNRMNFSKIDLTVMYYLPKPKNLAIRGAVGYTVAGGNVGQSTYFMGGLLYTFHFSKTEN
ncbi:MAG TPA: transporter [Cyclobacteriaceae bacterium]|nr:transporter [Cyclobacteriaceae bacterium]